MKNGFSSSDSESLFSSLGCVSFERRESCIMLSRCRVLPLLLLLTPLAAFLPFQNPPWPASYAMNQSTISMFCNSSGYFDPILSSSFGIASFDVRFCPCLLCSAPQR